MLSIRRAAPICAAIAIKTKREQDTSELERKFQLLTTRARSKLTRRTQEARQAPLVDKVLPWWRDGGDAY